MPVMNSEECGHSLEEFGSAMEQLHERSFVECGLTRAMRERVMADWQFRRDVSGGFDFLGKLSMHTALMWNAGRLDLTAESLLLSDGCELVIQTSRVSSSFRLIITPLTSVASG